MDTNDYISIQQFSVHYNVPAVFLNTLYDYELIEVITVNSTSYIRKTQIKHIERMIRLHFDLELNMEGIDVVDKLLKRVKILQEEIKMLHNRLQFFEDNN